MASKVPRIGKAPHMLGATLQLHIELRGTKPKVWRRVLVPQAITLARLHHVIQAAFGWSGGHLHEFMAGEQRYGTPDPDYDTPGSVQSERTKLTSALQHAATIDYVYDFGDYWHHRIKLEKMLPSDTQIKLPRCVGGANATPPDDCGGVPGYYEFVAAVTDPNHPEHAEMVQWIGRPWDPAEFDINRVNAWLNDIKL
jgi:Plasmid pRiA4b ORF-3-like protein